MKSIIFSVLTFLIFPTVSASNCTVQQKNFKLNNGYSMDCLHLYFEGDYEVQTCENGLGKLIDSKGDQRYIFIDAKFWVSRIDHVELSTQISTTEIVKMNFEFSKFNISRVKSDVNGVLVRKVECEGTISAIN